MDIKRKQHFWKTSQAKGLSLLLFVIVALMGAFLTAFLYEPVHYVSPNEIRVAQVMMRPFTENVRIQAQALPASTYRLDAPVQGVVQELFVVDGQDVRSGQPILKLHNASMELSYSAQRAQLLEQANNIRNAQFSLHEKYIESQVQVEELQYQLERARRQFFLDSNLFAQGAIATFAYQQSREEYTHLLSRFSLMQKRMESARQLREQQESQMFQAMRIVEQNLRQIEKNLAMFTIKAPSDGQCGLSDLQLGEVVNQGRNLGQVDNLSTFRLRGYVDEYYAHRIGKGNGVLANIGGEHVSGSIQKVASQVQQGQFWVDVVLDAVPEHIARGQNVQIDINLGAQQKVKTLVRDAFYNESKGTYCYVISSEGDIEKRAIVLGRQNAEYFEVSKGLAEGERVIVSSYANLPNNVKMKIENHDIIE